jgi:hypothetical protein
MGEKFDALKSVWHKFDAVIVLVLGVLGVIYVYKHIKALKDS